MKRIKVVNEPTELVPILRAVDTVIKKQVLQEVAEEWRTAREIEAKYGPEGKEALMFFEKMKLVDTIWQTSGSKQEKAYRTYYMSFHINTSCPITEICDILYTAMMTEKEFKKIETAIYNMVGDDGMFAGDVAEKQKLSATMLKSLIKRSSKLEYRGHRVERLKER